MANDEEERPTWWKISIQGAPKLGSVYWCKFNKAELVPLPEMWKDRPVIVVSHRDLRIKGSCLVLPTSTDPQDNNDWALELPDYITQQIDGRRSWALCSHPVTISTSRLRQIKGKVLKLKILDLNNILHMMIDWLPTPRA